MAGAQVVTPASTLNYSRTLSLVFVMEGQTRFARRADEVGTPAGTSLSPPISAR